MKTYLSLLCALFVLPLFAEDKKPTDFIRVDEDAKALRLQTGVTRYQKGDVTVDLIGAVHIADAKYFTQLNKEFTPYESLLFEMVGGADKAAALKGGEADAADETGKGGEADGKAAVEAKDPMMQMLGNVYAVVSKLLKLQGQKEGIDYTAKNFVHADLSLEEFEKLQAEKGESLIGFALQNANQGKEGGAPAMDTNKLLMALIQGDANAVKRQIVGTLGQGDDQVVAFAGNSVIIGDRNVKCLQVLDEQIKGGKKKLGIFYGAAHFPDMEKRMLKDGYRKVSHRWLTAWDVPKAQEAPKKEAPQKAAPAAAGK